jgi:hypothetical protein
LSYPFIIPCLQIAWAGNRLGWKSLELEIAWAENADRPRSWSRVIRDALTQIPD